DVRSLWVWTEHPVAVTRFEFVCLLGEELEVTDPIVARTGVVEVAPGQREQDREAAGRSSRDRNAVTVDQALLHQVARGVDAVVDVDHSPVPVEALPVGAAVARRATVVHVD